MPDGRVCRLTRTLDMVSRSGWLARLTMVPSFLWLAALFWMRHDFGSCAWGWSRVLLGSLEYSGLALAMARASCLVAGSLWLARVAWVRASCGSRVFCGLDLETAHDVYLVALHLWCVQHSM